MILGFIAGSILGFVTIIGFCTLVGKYKYRLYSKYINLYKITNQMERTELLYKYGFNIDCNCKPTLMDYFDAALSNNTIILLHWLRLVPVHGKKIGPINLKTTYEKKASFNDTFKAIHNRHKKQKDMREPFTNA